MVLKNPNKYQEGKTFVYFVRHGERISSKEDMNLEAGNLGLSSLGKKQAKEVAKKFTKIKGEIDVMYSSSMNRAFETAKEIAKSVSKKPIVYDSLSEFNKILWRKKYYHYKFWKHFIKYRGAMKTFNKILNEHKGKVIVIVAHGNIKKSFRLCIRLLDAQDAKSSTSILT